MKNRIRTSIVAIAALLAACTGNPSPYAGAAPAADETEKSPAVAAEPPHDAGASPNDSAPTTIEPKVVASFDAAAGELPEGLAEADGAAYVTFAPTGEIRRVDLATGATTRFSKLPTPVANKGFATGLLFGRDRSLYAALVSFDPSVRAGIYRVPSGGGEAKLFAQNPKMAFPNGLAFDDSGRLLVTDSAAGTIFAVDAAGRATPWATSDLLVGDKDACGGSGLGFPIGANGLVLGDDAFYVTNTDKGTIVRVAIDADGRAGAATIAAGPSCEALAGADGIALAESGDLIVAVNRQDKIVRIAPSGAIDVVARGGNVEFPASVWVSGDEALVTSFALANASAGKASRPSLVRFGIGSL